MLSRTTDPIAATETWLDEFEAALVSADSERLKALFHADSYWRDVLALTWNIETVNGRTRILEGLKAGAVRFSPSSFSVDHERTGPRRVCRAGTDAIESIFKFETSLGQGDGVLRLTEDARGTGKYKAWTLLTALNDLNHIPTTGAKAEPEERNPARIFCGPNWLDKRRAAVAFSDRDPAVLVVGGGQAGLAVAARLTALKVDTLVVDREKRIGDNWRKRYHALTLHNQTHVNHLPFMPYPPTWPAYIPKDKLAGWFEAYAEAMELNCWTGTEFQGGSYSECEDRWTVSLRREDGRVQVMYPRHVVMATGVSGIANWPEIPTLKNFNGTVMHSMQYQGGERWRGRKAIVVGTGTSGHDIAQDLHASGAEVSIVQRSPTMVVNIEPSAQLPYSLYSEGPPLDDCDLITISMPLTLLRKSHQAFTKTASSMDRSLLQRLEHRGFKLDFGEDGTGWQFKYLTRGGGYYFNVGCSELIADGAVRLVQLTSIEGFSQDGAKLRSGETLKADVVILATGYKGQDALVRRLFGEEVSNRVGPIWGFGTNDELRSMYTRTGQTGLWFMAGSLAQCRIYSKYLALQIKGLELGGPEFNSFVPNAAADGFDEGFSTRAIV